MLRLNIKKLLELYTRGLGISNKQLKQLDSTIYSGDLDEKSKRNLGKEILQGIKEIRDFKTGKVSLKTHVVKKE